MADKRVDLSIAPGEISSLDELIAKIRGAMPATSNSAIAATDREDLILVFPEGKDFVVLSVDAALKMAHRILTAVQAVVEGRVGGPVGHG